MTSTFLTPNEIEQLTDLVQPAAQRRWLTERRWRFEIGAAGRPKVLRSYAEAKMGTEGQSSTWRPDWSKV